ncbi:hypothetical protein, partial [Streptococcus pneumoniae]|uniref:hypothetical protein n=1 Tax=Streptococcus pneumoniae TaxID=1313 RepID=UPI0018B09041
VVILRFFTNRSVDQGQKKLELSSRDFDKIQAKLEGQQEQEDKETKEKVDEITKEQNTKPSTGNLVDWFRNRK